MSLYREIEEKVENLKESIHPIDKVEVRVYRDVLEKLENTSLLKWNTLDTLPEIPEGKYGVSVLMISYDSVYDEINPGGGYDTFSGIYGSTCDSRGEKLKWYEDTDLENDFMVLYVGVNDSSYGPVFDEILYWSYVPSMFDGKLVR